MDDKIIRGKIDSLQALRGLAFIGIFTSHSGLNSQLGAWGVSIFFILSGFLSYYNSYNKKYSKSLLYNIKNAYKKVHTLYKLHIIMLFVSIPYVFYSTFVQPHMQINYGLILSLISKFLLNIGLIQTVVPYMSWYASYNGVSWFLSSLLIVYIFAPYLILFIKKYVKLNVFAIISMLSVYFLQILFCFFTRNIWFDAGEFWGNYYFAYTFPFLRLGDFFIGCLLAFLFINKKEKLKAKEKIIYTIYEFLTLFLFIISVFLYTNNYYILPKWFALSELWVPSSILIILLFCQKKGIITQCLSNRIVIYIGNISNYNFLIHGMVLTYSNIITNHFIFHYSTKIYVYIIQCIINFILTVLCTVIYKKYMENFKFTCQKK